MHAKVDEEEVAVENELNEELDEVEAEAELSEVCLQLKHSLAFARELLCACMYACMRVCVYACVRARCVRACVCGCARACMRACVHACVRACVRLVWRVLACICLFLCMGVECFTCVCDVYLPVINFVCNRHESKRRKTHATSNFNSNWPILHSRTKINSRPKQTRNKRKSRVKLGKKVGHNIRSLSV